MKGITWSRDSHGLFDYESRHLTKKTLKSDKTMMLMRSGHELQLIPYDAEIAFQKQVKDNINLPDDKALLKIVNRNNIFYLESASYQHHPDDVAKLTDQGGKANLLSQESMYLVVRSLKHNTEKVDYVIQERDILRIGRVKFAVKEIGYANKPEPTEEETKYEKGHSSNSIFTDSKDEDFEEFTEVPAILSQKEEEGEKSGQWCRFCWASECSE